MANITFTTQASLDVLPKTSPVTLKNYNKDLVTTVMTSRLLIVKAYANGRNKSQHC